MRATSRKVRDYSTGVNPRHIKYDDYERKERFKDNPNQDENGENQ